MIAKKFRLGENEVKKVLRKGKPFFSYSIVLNTLPNTLGFLRFAIVIGGKSVGGSVERNFFRRLFYAQMQVNSAKEIEKLGFDLVFVVKRSTLLSEKNTESIQGFTKEILFLYKKLYSAYER